MVERMEWGLLTPDAMRSDSVCQITKFHGNRLETSVDKAKHSLCDRRMGPICLGEKCLTCNLDHLKCHGHFGHIELYAPIIPDHFGKHVRRILDSICPTPHCLAVFPVARPKKKCKECGVNLYPIQLQSKGVITSNDKKLDPIDILTLFKEKPDSVWEQLGFNPTRAHPTSMIFTVLPVVPTCIRPYTYSERGWMSNHLTILYSKIVYENEQLKRALIDKSDIVIENHISRLRDYVRNLYDTSKKTTNKTGKAMDGFKQRYDDGKWGRMRQNLMGMRVNYTLRTVASADPTLEFNEVGIPCSAALKMTLPETVTLYNIKRLRADILNGHITSTIEFKRKNQSIVMKYADKERAATTLTTGDIVHRPIRNGDIVLVNRQPSLHRESLMAHFIKLLPGKTIRIHMSTCPAYNADFDGDELNIHFIQSLEARAEAWELMGVEKNIVSPQHNAPMMSFIYDAVLGIRELSLPSTFVEKTRLFDILVKLKSAAKIPQANIFYKGKVYWTGKTVLSLSLPAECNYTHDDVIIKKGQIVDGELNKKKITRIVHYLFNDFGHRICGQFITNIQFTCTTWLSNIGYSITVMDGYAKERNSIISSLNIDEELKQFKTDGGRMDYLNSIRDITSASISPEKDNSCMAMILSGSKGSMMNWAQTTMMLGPQSLYGKLIPKTMNNGRRCLPHFALDENSAASRGFVINSFFTGLNPLEFFFHAIGGREGVINTAVTTAKTGYVERQLVKNMENISVCAQGLVRVNRDEVVQFKYGGDGFAREKMRHVPVISFYDPNRKRKWIMKLRPLERELVLGAEKINRYTK